MGCTTFKKERDANMATETISLTKRSTGSESFLAEIEVSVDGHSILFMLDTGAVSSSMGANGHAMSYPSLGNEESKGASGKATPCEIIQPQKLQIGNAVFDKPRIKRCGSNILGLDIIGKTGFEVDLQNLKLVFGIPTSISLTEPIRRLTPGHVTIPIKIENKAIDALFDTGADTSVIDSQFIENNKSHFELVRSEDGTDVHGHKIKSHIYRCRSLEVGTLRLQNVEMAAFDFGEHLRSKMEGSPLILGNNVISKAIWYFNLNSGKWVTVPYRN